MENDNDENVGGEDTKMQSQPNYSDFSSYVMTNEVYSLPSYSSTTPLILFLLVTLTLALSPSSNSSQRDVPTVPHRILATLHLSLSSSSSPLSLSLSHRATTALSFSHSLVLVLDHERLVLFMCLVVFVFGHENAC